MWSWTHTRRRRTGGGGGRGRWGAGGARHIWGCTSTVPPSGTGKGRRHTGRKPTHRMQAYPWGPCRRGDDYIRRGFCTSHPYPQKVLPSEVSPRGGCKKALKLRPKQGPEEPSESTRGYRLQRSPDRPPHALTRPPPPSQKLSALCSPLLEGQRHRCGLSVDARIDDVPLQEDS
jgi:hypothetical protein